MNARVVLACVVVTLVAATVALAQTPATPPVAPPSAASAKTELAPALDELEQAWLTIYALQQAYGQVLREADSCRVALAPYRAKGVTTDLESNLLELQSKIETRHPGYAWNPQTGTLTKRPVEQAGKPTSPQTPAPPKK